MVMTAAEFPQLANAATADLLEAIDAILPLLEEERAGAESRGRLSERAVAAMVDAGVSRLYLPASLGGLEVDPLTCAAVTERLAFVDTSAAWFVMVANAVKLMAAYWPETLVAELLQDPATIIAASGNKQLTAVAEGDGFRVNGVNSFVSGCHHAQWFCSPVMVGEDFMMSVLPMAECEILDNWQSLGMRGTGSNDVRVTDVWVPAAQLVAMQEPPGVRNALYSGALYLCPSRVLFATYVPVTLVLAERALAELADLAQGKTPYAEGEKLKFRSIAQIKYGRALATFRSSRAYFLDALAVAWERAQAGEAATPAQKADLYLAGTHAVQSSALVVRWVADAAGTSVIYSERPLERIVRDMETLRHHGFANESRYGSVAQLYWDAVLDYPLMLR